MKFRMSRLTSICGGVLTLLVLGEIFYAHRLGSAENVSITQGVVLLLTIFLTAILVAAFFVLVILPRLGEGVGSFIANPNEKAAEDPHDRAIALKTIGNMEGAAQEYQRLAEEDPQDLSAVSDAVQLWCEKVKEPQRAVNFLRALMANNLENARDPACATFLANTLADVYRVHLSDEQSAQEVWAQFIAQFPDSPEAVVGRADRKLYQAKHSGRGRFSSPAEKVAV